jgi:predicted  nucleic acid-binding Zn-ribbon protein
MATKKMKITALKESILILETDLRMASKVFNKDVKRMQEDSSKENVDKLQNRIYAVLRVGGEIEALEKELKLLQGGK